MAAAEELQTCHVILAGLLLIFLVLLDLAVTAVCLGGCLSRQSLFDTTFGDYRLFCYFVAHWSFGKIASTPTDSLS